MGKTELAANLFRITQTDERIQAEEFRFWIDAYTPAKIPMARLAEYMAELATMLGEPTSVHFVKLERGSFAIVHRVEPEAIPKDTGLGIRTVPQF